MSTPEVVAEATRLAAPVADRWLEAARCGLSDPDIRSVAADLLSLAAVHARTPDAADQLFTAAQRCRRGRAPTSDELRRPEPESGK
jgi:glutamate--cysteine ligase